MTAQDNTTEVDELLANDEAEDHSNTELGEDASAVSAALQRLSSLRSRSRAQIAQTTGGKSAASPMDQIEDAADMLQQMNCTAYHWDFHSDKINWADNASATLSKLNPNIVATGEAFERIIDPAHARARRLAILEARDAGGTGLSSYKVQYRICTGSPNPADGIWIEEEGTWNALEDGDAARPETRRTRATALLRALTQTARIEEELHYLTRYDDMSGQLTRTYFSSLLLDALQLDTNGDRLGQICVLLVSIPNLHMINESFGYAIGDEMIVHMGKRLRHNLRRGDVIGRYASNKFAILLKNCDRDGMTASARRLINAVEQENFATTSGFMSGKVGIGGVLVEADHHGVEQIMGQALDALDQANARPLDRFVIFEQSLQRDNLRRKNNSIASEVTEALTTGRVQFAMQPIVSAENLAPLHYECLVRIERDGGQVVAAAQFMPVAERMGFARPIDRRVLELVLDYARHRPEMHLAFNVSGLTTLDYGWLDALEKGIGNDRTLANRLMVEITETSALTEIEDTSKFVTAVKALGCKVAIDDFGAGYTSFRNLKLLDVDMVKIDASFIKDIYQSQEDQLFVRTMISLAFNLGLDTVAEGVRDQRTAELLRSMGITFLQGYYFGRPKLVTPYYDFTEQDYDTDTGYRTAPAAAEAQHLPPENTVQVQQQMLQQQVVQAAETAIPADEQRQSQIHAQLQAQYQMQAQNNGPQPTPKEPSPQTTMAEPPVTSEPLMPSDAHGAEAQARQAPAVQLPGHRRLPRHQRQN